MSVFAGVVDRAAVLSGAFTMSSERWRQVPVRHVPIGELVATQPGVIFRGLLEDRPAEGGDRYPHVVVFRGVKYLEDGHHRVIRAALDGLSHISARVLETS